MSEAIPGPGPVGTGPVGGGLLGDDVFVTTPDGRRLRTMVAGPGSTSGSGADDLVVLEAGMGASGLYWGPVHALLAPHVRVVAYERAGFGASDPDPHRRDLPRLAADLAAVVAAHPHRRLVLVGHSWGGPIVRTLAARRLRQGLPVDGLVLVDPSDENAPLYFSPAARTQFALHSATSVLLARTGMLARMYRPVTAGLSPELARATTEASTSTAAGRAGAAEGRQLVTGLQSLLAAPPVLGGVPIAVLSGLQASGRFERRIRTALVRAHAVTAGQHPRAHQVTTQRSGHQIPVTEPDLVAAQTLALLGPG